MIALLAATIVVALVSLGAYVNVAAQRDYLELRVANLEYRIKVAEAGRRGEDS